MRACVCGWVVGGVRACVCVWVVCGWVGGACVGGVCACVGGWCGRMGKTLVCNKQMTIIYLI